jgi:hypothetical protein
VLVEPDKKALRALEVGDSVPMLRLPSDRVVRTAGSRYAIVIDPATLPANYVNDDGSVG